MNLKLVAAMTAAVFSASGCGTWDPRGYAPYRTPTEGPTARIQYLPPISHTPATAGFALSSQIYIATPCSDIVHSRQMVPKGESIVGPVITIEAEKETPFWLTFFRDEAMGTRSSSSASGDGSITMSTMVRRYSCDAPFAFTPKRDAFYQIQYTIHSPRSCEVTINEQVQGEAGATFKKVEDVKPFPSCN